MSVAGLVLAAGAGRRFGRPKAGVELEGVTLVERSARALRLGGCGPVVAVLGAEIIDVPGADVIVHNPAWADGLGSSLRAGLDALEARGPDVEAVVVVLCDQPGLGGPAVERMRSASEGASSLAVATFAGVRAHPVLLGADHWGGVGELAVGERGAKPYLERQGDAVREVACDGLGDAADVDRPDDLTARGPVANEAVAPLA